MNTIKDLAIKWCKDLSNREKAKLTFYFDAVRRWEELFEAEIENIFYQEVILKWGIVQISNIAYYKKEEVIEIYLKEHTKEQPQSVDNTIDVEEVQQPYFKGKGEHSVNELEKMCQQYKDYVSHINSQPKAIYNDVWDEELINKFFYYLKYDKGVDIEDSFMNDFKQHYSLIKK